MSKRRLFSWLSRRTLTRMVFLFVIPLLAICVGLYLYAAGGRYVSTDNAYVKANVIIITPEVSGRVTSVLVADNQAVEAGDVLLQLDPSLLDIELNRARAQMAVIRTELESLRQHLNATRSGEQPKLTYLPFLMQALVRTLQQHPGCNALYDDERNVVVQHEALHVGIATQTDDGLMVPVVRHAEARDVWDCANEMRRVSQAAREKTATTEELSGSTITITSLGALGGLGATPIINHPEVAIIGVHKAEERAVVRDGNIVVRRMMNLSGSFDHRVVDGYNGARMMQTLKQMLEHPATIFI